MNIFKPILIILASFIFLFISHTAFSQENDSLYYLNPEKFTASLLFKKKIVMLADYGITGHYYVPSYHSLITTIDEWVKLASISDTSQQKLIVVLEKFKRSAETVNEYISASDFKPVYRFYNPNGYLEEYEYFSDLLKLKMKIDSINLIRKNTIYFELKGYESGLSDSARKEVEFTEEFINIKSREEKAIWFVKKRDSLTANAMIIDSKNYSDAKVLVFYGQGHLIDGYLSKRSAVPELPDSLTYSYYLVHYLKEYFGEENVATVYQGCVEKQWMDLLKFKDVKNFEILIHNKDFPTINNEKSNPSCFDYYALRQPKNIPIHPDCQIFSRCIIENIISELKFIEPYLPAYLPNITYFRDIHVLSLLTGVNFNNAYQAEEWYNKNSYDGLARLDSKEFGDSAIAKAKISKGFRLVLNQLGWSERILNDSFIPDEKDWIEAKPIIKFVNCIGIYWLGYPDEKVKAKEYLVKFSGEDFAEPEKYLQWYRMKYYGYEY